MKRVFRCVLLSGILLTGASCKGYTGPAVKFSLGWNGVQAGITLYGRKHVSESLEDAGRSFDAITAPYASSGKTHVSAPP